MEQQSHISEELILEITRYLAAVDAFRAERCEPKWLPELAHRSFPAKQHLRPERSVSDVAS